MSAVPVPVLWLYDPTALEQSQGKSEIGWEIFVQVRKSGAKVAYIDLPHYAFLAPAPAADPANRWIKARSIAALWPGFADDGAQCVIVFSSTDGEDVASEWVEAAIPGAVLTFCRVEAARQDAGETARVLRANNGNWPGLP